MSKTYIHLTTQERAVVMTMRDDPCSTRSRLRAELVPVTKLVLGLEHDARKTKGQTAFIGIP